MVNLKILNKMKYKLKKISGDASFREFYRVTKDKNSSIIITAKKEKFKNIIVYCAINEILRKNKIFCPKLISFIKEDLIEVTDLGLISFYDIVLRKKNKLKYYKELINTLIKIQKIKLKKKTIFRKYVIRFENYSINNLHKESDLFFDWYLVSLFKKTKAFKLKKIVKKELNKIYRKIYYRNSVFTHRDFHASNIMVYKKRFGIIDSQDAIIGNPLYDVASLIEDVRIKIPNKIKNKIFDFYLKKTKLNKLNSRNDYDILSVQRNLKILGIFTRLYKRDKKASYLKYLPYTWNLIENRMKNPIFYNLKKIFDKEIPQKIRKKI